MNNPDGSWPYPNADSTTAAAWNEASRNGSMVRYCYTLDLYRKLYRFIYHAMGEDVYF